MARTGRTGSRGRVWIGVIVLGVLPLALADGSVPRSAAGSVVVNTAGGRIVDQASVLAQAVQERSVDEMIRDATSAGPPAVTEEATIMEWPREPGGEFRVLREGTNGWWCIASTEGAVLAGLEDPTCDDATWLEFERAYLEGREPVIDDVGIAYMLSGDAGVSNTDPFATGPTADNAWHVSGPHIMILVPDPSMLAGVSTDPHDGGPYVMWANTPYAHVMVPVEALPGTSDPPATTPTVEDKLDDARRALPTALAERATILDRPANEEGELPVLREGGEEWVCLATPTAVWQQGERSAFCDDPMWQAWGAALSAGEEPVIERLGISYNLNYHTEGSNTDPFASGPTPDNEWHHIGPHVAVLVPDPTLYEGWSTDPHGGEPFVMFADTPYAHIMVPLEMQE